MTLTPVDIHNTEFARASLGRRGYDENDVDALLDEATGEMIRLLEENDALRTMLGTGGPVADPAGPGGAAQAELSEATAAVDRAHQECERAEHGARLARRQLDEAYRAAAATGTARGEASAERVLTEASAERVLTMAQRTADGYVSEAQEKARVLLAGARERADRTLRDAQDAVDAIDRKSDQHQNQAAADLSAGRAALVRDIDDLTRLVAGYRIALEQHLHRQGQLIDGTAG